MTNGEAAAVLSPTRATARDPGASTQDLPAARAWLGLSLGTLLLAGLGAVLLVLGRVLPLLGVTAAGDFFRRALIVHVDLALVVWFYAFLGGLVALLPGRRVATWPSRLGVLVAGAGVAVLLTGLVNVGALPVLCNYIPVLDHPAHLLGLGLFALGLALAFTDGRLLPGREAASGPVRMAPAARVAIRSSAVLVLVALVTLAAAVAGTPDGFLPRARYELYFWGPGHILQAASACAMASAWLMLLTPALGDAPVSRGAASALFGLLVAPFLVGPLLAIRGTPDVLYHSAFTRLMELGIAPALLVLLGLCLRALVLARRDGRLPRPLEDARVTGFLASAVMTILGFCFGAAISGSNTVVPAHYHASVGGVTAAFMALTYVLLDALGAPVPARLRPLCRWQPVLYGIGQVVFAVGFGASGMYGLARKAYGTEQVVRSTAETVGLWVMGTGGAVAVLGGALFITIVGAAWRARRVSLLSPGLEVA